MESSSFWQLEKEYHTIAEYHDFVVRVIEYEVIKTVHGDGENVEEVYESKPKKVDEFKVQRDVLVGACDFFRKALQGGYKEREQTVIDMHEENGHSWEIWFKILHGANAESTYSSIDLLEVWNMLATAHRHGINPKSTAAKAWFQGWMEAKNKERNFDFKDYQSLLFPCYTFDNAPGFQAASKYLVYRATGHVTERRPDGFDMENLRLDQIIIQQINAAKGRLKTILHRNLYKPILELLEHSRCDCDGNVHHYYERSLYATGAWPLETTFQKNSVHEILAKLRHFANPKVPHCDTCRGRNSQREFKYIVNAAIKETREYFDGLCLDCMDASKPKYRDADEDYWNHAKTNVKWDSGCRVRHGQPTWYFSFMGRRQKMIEWQQRPRPHHRRNSSSSDGWVGR